MSRRRAGWLAPLLLAVATSACAPAGAAYRVSGLHVTSPASDVEVRLPLTITWADDQPQAGYLVFIDRAPVGVGGGVDDLVDTACRRTRGCPDAGFFVTHGIFQATTQSATITAWPATRGSTTHRVVVVRVDAQGHRVGEAFASLELLTPKAS